MKNEFNYYTILRLNYNMNHSNNAIRAKNSIIYITCPLQLLIAFSVRVGSFFVNSLITFPSFLYKNNFTTLINLLHYNMGQYYTTSYYPSLKQK